MSAESSEGRRRLDRRGFLGAAAGVAAAGAAVVDGPVGEGSAVDRTELRERRRG